VLHGGLDADDFVQEMGEAHNLQPPKVSEKGFFSLIFSTLDRRLPVAGLESIRHVPVRDCRGRRGHCDVTLDSGYE
jgi:hypothetical protein